MISYPVPLLGFAAFSGTGKTTLLLQLIPKLREQGLHLAVLKRAHHQFDIDHPGRDSYQLRKAGAEQMLITSRCRMAWITEFDADYPEPSLEECLQALRPERLDLILIEGFKKECFPKIELHRPILSRPLLFPSDPNIIAVASDTKLPNLPNRLPQFDLNNVDEIIHFIFNHHLHQTSK